MYTIPEKSISKNVLDYFKQNEYKNDKDYFNHGYWAGVGAEVLGFSMTNIEDGELQKLPLGLHPKTDKKIAKKSKLSVNNAYWQSVLSAPKEVSLIYFIDEDISQDNFERDKAIVLQKTLEYIDTFVYGKLNSKNEMVKTSAIFACFDHETSRASGESIRPDPQIHTHLLASNVSVVDDEKCLSFSNRKLFYYQKAIGPFYRACWAEQIRKYGYETCKRTDFEESDDGKSIKVNSFGIVGITDEQRNLFSKRNNQIIEMATKLGINHSNGRKKVANKNKIKKSEDFTREELINIWKEDAKTCGITQSHLREHKQFKTTHFLANLQTDEKLFQSIVRYEEMTHKNLTIRINEMMQHTGVVYKAENLINKWKEQGKITDIGGFKFKCNIDLTKVDYYEKKLRNRITVDKNNVIREIKAGATTEDIIYKKSVVNKEEPGITLRVNPVKKKPSKQKTFGNFLNISSSINTILNLGLQIGLLENRLRDIKISEFEKISIRLQINELKRQIEEIRKQNLNKYLSKKPKLY